MDFVEEALKARAKEKAHGAAALHETCNNSLQCDRAPVGVTGYSIPAVKIGHPKTGKPAGAARVLDDLEAMTPVHVIDWRLLLELRNGSPIQFGVEDGAGKFGQHVFVIDFDNEGDAITPEEALQRSRENELKVLCLYFTDSSTPEHPRFHICFEEWPPVTSRRNAQAIFDLLHRIFPESDPTFAKPGAVAFGSNGIVWDADGREWEGWKEVAPWLQC